MNFPESIDLAPFRGLAELGPAAVADEAKGRGYGPIDTIRIIRSICAIEFVSAKEITTQVHYGITLEEHQASLIPMLEAVIAELENENKT